ncbi:hypothetical protein ABFA07_014485 [Porites harrisoni]
MDLEELSNFWARFQIAFSWDYPEGLDVQTVQSAVFHVVGDGETRAQDQLVVGCVQSAGAGVTLTRPRSDSDIIPCEMSFTAHPMAQEFYIKNIVIVSEARNVELYIDDNYERTAKGIMLTIRKGRKVSLFETEFDLTEFIHGTCRCLIKFLSFSDEQSMRLQTIVVRVARSTVPAISATQVQNGHVMDRIRSLSVGSGPRSDLGASSFSGSETSILAQAMVRAKQFEEEEKQERMGGDLPGSPEKDEGFINMLAGLMLEKSPEAAANTRPAENGDVDPPESPALAKHRWETYLQSRVRASRNMVQRSRPVSLGSALPKPTHSQMNPRTQSFCLGDKRTVEGVVAEQAPAPPPLGKAEADGSDSANRTRCSECGCPGCLSVYNSITTNIYATEKRIMGRVDAKLQALLENMNSRFDNLFESLLLRQEQMLLGFQSTPKNSFSSSRKYPQRNGHKGGDTSV